ncbi:MAG TPA: type-F conjugative transfer system pilin assembly protein TrbC, partial [Gammaproteobacteria bacterium]|nr:type-F conjugative transfer system pilin assembly protein TrbC [Gammaproteobacteria bacterium]
MRYKIRCVIFVLLLFGLTLSHAQKSASENLSLNEPIEPEQAQLEKSLESGVVLSEEDKRWMLEQVKCCQKINITDDIATELRTFMSQDSADATKIPVLSDDIPDQKTALKAAAFNSINDSALLVFVSFSMPKQSLQAWARQAKKAGGTLVLRGLVDNSLRKTLLKIQDVLGAENLNTLNIDPLAFETFGIHTVPAVIVTDQTQAPALALSGTPRFDVI